MALTPKKIYEDLLKNEIDKSFAADLLISFIENAEISETRLEGIEFLQKIEHKSQKVFSFLENLLLSDYNTQIRILASKTLVHLFKEKALGPLNWALKHEKSLRGLVAITAIIAGFRTNEVKAMLIDKISHIYNVQFKTSLNSFIKSNTHHDFSSEELAKLINNYIVITKIKEVIQDFNYKVVRGLVFELDLSYIMNDSSSWKVLKNLDKFLNVLSDLKWFNLKSNKIGAFPPSISNLTSLVHLDLSHNSIKILPDSINNLNSLKYLNLKYNLLTAIPSSIGSLKSLEVLDLKHNILSSLPDSISNLNSLRVLNLHGNTFRNIPESIKNLTSLRKLELGLNKLRSIPTWIKDLTALERLVLGRMKSIDNINDLINTLPFLTTLDLYGNNIEDLPDSIGRITSLEKLLLNNNKLRDLPKTLKNLKSLKKLDISWNYFTNLPNWIDSLYSLEELNISGNQFKTLPDSIASLPSLKTLNIKLNKQLVEIPESIKRLQQKGLKIHN